MEGGKKCGKEKLIDISMADTLGKSILGKSDSLNIIHARVPPRGFSYTARDRILQPELLA